ncbi:hypothetical protein GRF59_04540 [Paenibacillus sp. HJL G12]|uniref:Uncharacterized protein n=1 Tax=Paenibacillus dendrobii TaxID=2691084 RepID=A0A7X3IFE0_9BACL|nr:hypothetical protein [Paenibacillus dendrobii]MWV42888.1 hypothetical protein [Paenibacillus dendrobii]
MKKYDKYIPLFVLLYVLAVAGSIFNLVQMYTSFNHVVSGIIDGKEVTSMEIRSFKLDQNREVNITDKQAIANVMKAFSEVKLRETRASSFDFRVSYWMTIHLNDDKNFYMTLYDDKYMMIYDPAKTKDKSRSYVIRNEFDVETVERFFQPHE